MNSKDYWAKRSALDMVEYMRTADETATLIKETAEQALEVIRNEIKGIFSAFTSFGISEADAKRILSGGGTVLQQIRRAAEKLEDPKQKQALLSAINSAGAYRFRIQRLEEVGKQITEQCKQLYKAQLEATETALRSVAEDAYYHTMFNLQKETGLAFSFAQFPKKQIDKILAFNWSGAHFSQRIWRNTDILAQAIKDEMLVSLLSGRSNAKTMQVIREQFNVNSFCAWRLVRTESSYVSNAAVSEGYKEADIEKYRFIATLDNRTSEECSSLDGKVFKLADKKVGTNFPPMHPFCRSTTLAEFGEETLKSLQRRARDKDGKTMKVPADITYQVWAKENGITVKKSFYNSHSEVDYLASKSNVPDSILDIFSNDGIIKEDVKLALEEYYSLKKTYQIESDRVPQLEKEADDAFDKWDSYFDTPDTPEALKAESEYINKTELFEKQKVIVEKIEEQLSLKGEQLVPVINDVLSEYLGLSNGKIDFVGLPYEMAIEILESTTITISKYPMLKSHLTSMKFYDMFKDGNKHINGACNALRGTVDFYAPMKNMSKIRKTYLEDVAEKFHVAGTDSRAITVHELGHALDGYMTRHNLCGGKINSAGVSRSSDFIQSDILQALGWNDIAKARRQELLSKGTAPKIATAVIDKELKQFITDHISGYAAVNSHEFFAELFAEYVMSPNPRKAAMIFGDIIDEALGVKKS